MFSRTNNSKTWHQIQRRSAQSTSWIHRIALDTLLSDRQTYICIDVPHSKQKSYYSFKDHFIWGITSNKQQLQPTYEWLVTHTRHTLMSCTPIAHEHINKQNTYNWLLCILYMYYIESNPVCQIFLQTEQSEIDDTTLCKPPLITLQQHMYLYTNI